MECQLEKTNFCKEAKNSFLPKKERMENEWKVSLSSSPPVLSWKMARKNFSLALTGFFALILISLAAGQNLKTVQLVVRTEKKKIQFLFYVSHKKRREKVQAPKQMNETGENEVEKNLLILFREQQEMDSIL